MPRLAGVRSGLLRLDRALQRSLRRRFERRLGVSLTDEADLREFGLEDSDRVFYTTSPTVTLRRALARLDPGPSDVFADLGAGKGGGVLVAAQLGFGRVIGVELAEELTRDARRNVERARPHLRTTDIELVTADALEWEIPDDLSVLYLYSPFVGEVFSGVMERVFASYDSNPRRLRIVYGYPFEHDRLVRTGRVAVVDVNSEKWPARPGWWDTAHVIVTYEVGPAGGFTPTLIDRGGFRWQRAIEHWSRPNDMRYELHFPGGGALYSHPPDAGAPR